MTAGDKNRVAALGVVSRRSNLAHQPAGRLNTVMLSRSTPVLLATVIATFGVLSDSTATVISAMIVAPLMGPIMATAAAIVMGSAQRALRSQALVVVGVLAVIALSILLTRIVPDVTISLTENREIGARIAPGLMALVTALESGAAGAFITMREEIADSMGGVAIAISLAPPLCVVGIGSGDLLPLRVLASQLVQTLRRPLLVKLRILPSQIEASSGNAP